jgi:hypothetical protein
MDNQHTNDSRQQEIVDALIRVDTAYGAAMASAHVATGAATEAAQAALAGMAASVTYQDELGVSRTVVVTKAVDDLATTAPAVEGGSATTGPATS